MAKQPVQESAPAFQEFNLATFGRNPELVARVNRPTYDGVSRNVLVHVRVPAWGLFPDEVEQIADQFRQAAATAQAYQKDYDKQLEGSKDAQA